MNSADIKNGQFETEITGLNFAKLFDETTSPSIPARTASEPGRSEANAAEKTSGCEFKFGTIPLVDAKKFSFGSGILRVYGYAPDDEGIDVTVVAETYFNFEFRPN